MLTRSIFFVRRWVFLRFAQYLCLFFICSGLIHGIWTLWDTFSRIFGISLLFGLLFQRKVSCLYTNWNQSHCQRYIVPSKTIIHNQKYWVIHYKHVQCWHPHTLVWTRLVVSLALISYMYNATVYFIWLSGCKLSWLAWKRWKHWISTAQTVHLGWTL